MERSGRSRPSRRGRARLASRALGEFDRRGERVHPAHPIAGRRVGRSLVSRARQGAVIVIFESEDAAQAEAEAADVAMGVGDTTVAGNTVWGVDLSVSDSEDAEVSMEGCVPEAVVRAVVPAPRDGYAVTRHTARAMMSDPKAGLSFDDDAFESRLVWIFGSTRSGSTWLLNLLCHPLEVGPDDGLGFSLPAEAPDGSVIDALPVNEFLLGHHLLPEPATPSRRSPVSTSLRRSTTSGRRHPTTCFRGTSRRSGAPSFAGLHWFGFMPWPSEPRPESI